MILTFTSAIVDRIIHHCEIYKVILINVQIILNKYVHMLSYMSCIEGAHYDNRIQCNHRFTYTVC